MQALGGAKRYIGKGWSTTWGNYPKPVVDVKASRGSIGSFFGYVTDHENASSYSWGPAEFQSANIAGY